jgi:hypothetical protein
MIMRNHETDRDELIAEVMRRLDVCPARREECRNEVIHQIQSAKARRNWNRKIGQPGPIKKKAAALRASLAKAQMLSKQIELFFSSVLDDMVEYDVNRNYEAFKNCLSDGILASEGIERQIIVPKGKKPKNDDKYTAKMLAVSLVNGFSDAYNERLQNNVASLLYELLTGVADVDIPESADDHRPPFLQTRGRIKTQR